MIKKIISAVVLLAVILTACISVSAADMPSKNNAVLIDANGAQYQMYFIITSAAKEKEIKDKVPDANKATFDPDTDEFDDLVLEGFIEGNKDKIVFPVTIRIDIKGVPVGTKFKITYFLPDGTSILIDGVVKDGRTETGSDIIYSPSIEFKGETWLEMIFANEIPLDGIYYMSYTVPLKSPPTDVDYTQWYAIMATCFVLLMAASVYTVKTAKQN